MTPGRERPTPDSQTAPQRPPADDRNLASRFDAIRLTTEWLASPLSPEDSALQSMPDASPVKWHLAHTSWFFETFVLEPALSGYARFDESFRVLFNSYYNLVGSQHPRPERGLISRPSLGEVLAYRAHVDAHVRRLFEVRGALDGALTETFEIGLNHEQQHQELILTDVKHLLSSNPLLPVYQPAPAAGAAALDVAAAAGAPWRAAAAPAHVPGAPGSGMGEAAAGRWRSHGEGVLWIGHEGPGFAFDNEGPRHRAFLHAFRIAARPVTNADYLEFMKDRGYDRPELWLSDGWATVQSAGWKAPSYWIPRDGGWSQFTLSGLRDLDPAAPVCHVSYYEADAFARWAGMRLPTEAEWEIAARAAVADGAPEGSFMESGLWHPARASAPPSAASDASGSDAFADEQWLGSVWEWTQSPYVPYPGYKTPAGALGEYNGKFMCNQLVLRGGSCATPRTHIRTTYRNFFPPSARWQFSGIRLARDAG